MVPIGFTLIILLICGIVLFWSSRSEMAGRAWRIFGSGLLAIALMMLAVLYFGSVGSESVAYGFGFAVILIILLLLVVAVAMLAGALLRKRNKTRD